MELVLLYWSQLSSPTSGCVPARPHAEANRVWLLFLSVAHIVVLLRSLADGDRGSAVQMSLGGTGASLALLTSLLAPQLYQRHRCLA